MGQVTTAIVICTRNRPVDLERTLRSLAWQQRPADRILVVDDSDPERREETTAVVAAVGGDVEVRVKETPGLTASRNLAIDAVDEDVIVFLDDDVVLRPDYLEVIASAFESDPGLAGAGGSIDDDHDYEFGWLRGLLMIPGRKTGRVYPSGWSTQTPQHGRRRVQHLIGCNMAYRTSVLASYRFSTEFRGYALGEDLELSHRLHRDGHRLEVLAGAHLWHVTGAPTPDRAWGYREVVIRPIVAGPRFNRAAFVVSAVAFALVNLGRNRERAAGNLAGIRDVLFGRAPEPVHTVDKDGS